MGQNDSQEIFAMGKTASQIHESIQLHPIGFVRNQIQHASWGPRLQDLAWQEKVKRMREQRQSVSEIIVNPEYEQMLDGIEEFSHILVIFWSHLVPEEKCMETRIHPLGSSDFPQVGVFATHSPARPNRILLTPVRLLERRNTVLKVSGLDALDGSPVLDLKSHVPEQNTEMLKTPEWYKKNAGSLCQKLRAAQGQGHKQQNIGRRRNGNEQELMGKSSGFSWA